MDLKGMDVCYNSIEIFLSLVSIFNFNFNRQYSSPNCHSKSRHVGKHHRVQSKIFLSLLNALGVSIGSIRPPNRSITPLFGSQNIDLMSISATQT